MYEKFAQNLVDNLTDEWKMKMGAKREEGAVPRDEEGQIPGAGSRGESVDRPLPGSRRDAPSGRAERKSSVEAERGSPQEMCLSSSPISSPLPLTLRSLDKLSASPEFPIFSAMREELIRKKPEEWIADVLHNANQSPHNANQSPHNAKCSVCSKQFPANEAGSAIVRVAADCPSMTSHRDSCPKSGATDASVQLELEQRRAEPEVSPEAKAPGSGPYVVISILPSNESKTQSETHSDVISEDCDSFIYGQDNKGFDNSSDPEDSDLGHESPERPGCFVIPETIPEIPDGVTPEGMPSKYRKQAKDAEGVGFGSVSSLPFWARKAFKRSESVRSETESKNVTMIAHRRRGSMPATDQKGRRGSVKNILFGQGGSRRFSQDLRIPKDMDEDDDELPEQSNETAKVIFFQVFIPFLIAGFGNVGAGIILDQVQHWDVFITVTELFILVASFLGFKGNLEMTLAARLSTQANLGNLDDPTEQWRIGCGNVALIQCQAIVVAFLAAVIAIAVDYLKDFAFDTPSALLICATSLVTASITGLFLASLMVVVIIIARKTGVNPDNVSTLIAAFLGDITAVALLSGTAKLLFDFRHLTWLSPVIIVIFVLVLPISLVIARRNPYTHDIVGTGWFPIIIAMVISSIGGFIFDFAVGLFETIAIFQPIINGVGSNLVAVQASRISTYFHQRVPLGTLPPDEDGNKYHPCQSPIGAFFGSNPNVKTARLLLLMAIPGHIIYIVTIRLIKQGDVLITGPFLVFYLLVAIVQTFVLLYIAHVLVPLLWKKKIDPDNAAIPGIMAMGDLLGTALLTLAYLLLASIDDPNALIHT